MMLYSACVARLGSRTRLNLHCLACTSIMVRSPSRWLGLHPCGLGRRWGGGAVLASQGSRWGWAADALACAACSPSSAKMGGGSVTLALLGSVCLAWFVWLALVLSRGHVSLHCMLPAQGEGGGVSVLSLLGPHCWCWPRAKFGKGGQQRLLHSGCLAHACWCWQSVGGSALMGNWGNVGALVVAHWRWGVVGTAAASRQQGFCWAILLGHWRWHVGGVVVLSPCWHRRAGVGG
jgi:hypothetical protein